MAKYHGLDCILLIDDDTPTNYLHKMVIDKTGIDVNTHAVTTAMEALSYLTATGKYDGHILPQPGIIFLDINMPAMDGWEFMEEYKSLNKEQKARIVVFMLSTSLNTDDRIRAEKNADIVTFLSKPLTIDAVNELVNQHYTLLE